MTLESRESEDRPAAAYNNLDHPVKNVFFDEWAKENRCGVCGLSRDKDNNCVSVSGRYKT